MREPVPCQWRSVTLGAIAAACVDPVLLDQIVARAERHVVERPVWRGGRRAERPRTLVGVFVAPAIVPGVQVWVGYRFLELVRDDARHAVGAGITVRPGRLRRTSAGASIRIANERVLDVRACDGSVCVP